MKYPTPLLSALLLLISCGAAVASDTPLTYDRVSLSENAATDVENDTLVAVLFVQRDGRSAPQLANQVNRVMDSALQKLQGIPQIKVQTQAYRTNAVYKDGRISGWRVNQSLRLESQDSKLLGDTVGQLQDTLNVQSISYRVSDEARRQHTDQLIQTALQRFQQRASHIARAMGKANYRLVSLQVHNGQAPIPVQYDSFQPRLAQASMAAPRIEAGTQRVEVSVTGEIELQD